MADAAHALTQEIQSMVSDALKLDDVPLAVRLARALAELEFEQAKKSDGPEVMEAVFHWPHYGGS